MDKGFRRGGRRRVQVMFEEPSRTKQQFRDECDINTLMKKYQAGFAITHLNRYEGSYADVSNPVTYREALDIVRRSDEMFASLPSSVRSRFENDPQSFLAFATDPANLDEMRSLGLARKGPEPVQPVEEAVSAGEVKP